MKILTVFKPSKIYNESHVQRLSEQVRKYSDFELTVINGHYPSWWCKMDIYSVKGPCLYMDLDTTIVDDLTPLIEHVEKHEFIAMRNFNHMERIGGMLLAWNGDMSHLLQTFQEYPDKYMEQYRSDQEWLDDHVNPVFWQDLLPNHVHSYKKYVNQNGIHKKCRIVAFHGNPRPWAIDELVKE